MRAQDGKCALCKESMTLKKGDPHFATVDHIIPLSLGGEDSPKNKQLACYSCNTKKGCQLLEQIP